MNAATINAVTAILQEAIDFDPDDENPIADGGESAAIDANQMHDKITLALRLLRGEH